MTTTNGNHRKGIWAKALLGAGVLCAGLALGTVQPDDLSL